jgi:uncharacterized protein (DUF1330 family)
MVLAIFYLSVTNLPRFLEYAEGHRPSIDQYGGKVLFESHDLEAIEGTWVPAVVIVQDWPSADAFRKWYNSKEYRPWRERAREGADLHLVLAKGRP